jgi:hypothetical protein
MVMVDRVVISGLLVWEYDKNNRIIRLDSGHQIQCWGKKMLPKALM